MLENRAFLNPDTRARNEKSPDNEIFLCFKLLQSKRLSRCYLIIHCVSEFQLVYFDQLKSDTINSCCPRM